MPSGPATRNGMRQPQELIASSDNPNCRVVIMPAARTKPPVVPNSRKLQ
jgi:hypothetical protein